jgi:hypothetical protein
LDNIISGTCLKDSIQDITVHSIVAVQPQQVNGLLWFGKIICFVESDHLELLWLHKSTNISKFFYLNDTPDIVYLESIICNGVEFEPVYRNQQLLWKLLTPIPFIQALNSNSSKMPTLAAFFTT